MTLEECELICWSYDLLPGQQICRNCREEENQTEPEEMEFETIEQSTQFNMFFESATDFVKKPLKLFHSSPLKGHRTVKLGNPTVLIWFSFGLKIMW